MEFNTVSNTYSWSGWYESYSGIFLCIRYILYKPIPAQTHLRASASSALRTSQSSAMDDPPTSPLKAFATFLIRHHSDQLRSIAHSPDPKLHYPLFVE